MYSIIFGKWLTVSLVLLKWHSKSSEGGLTRFGSVFCFSLNKLWWHRKFRLSLEECKVCRNADCIGDSLQIIKSACFDSLQLGCPTISGYLPFLLFLKSLLGESSPQLFWTFFQQLSSLMSIPLSTSTTTNDYIDSINSEFNFQLAELTVFQFPYSDQRKSYLLYFHIVSL